MSLEQRLRQQANKSARVADMGGYGLSGGSNILNTVLPEYGPSQESKDLQGQSPMSSKMYSDKVMHAMSMQGGYMPSNMMNYTGVNGSGLSYGQGVTGGGMSYNESMHGGFAPWLIPLASAVLPHIVKAIKGGALSGGCGCCGAMPGHMDGHMAGMGLSGGMPASGGHSLESMKYAHSFPSPGFFPGVLEQASNMPIPRMEGSGPSGGMLSGGLPASGGKACKPQSKKQMAWISKVKKYAAENNVSYKDAMVALKGSS